MRDAIFVAVILGFFALAESVCPGRAPHPRRRRHRHPRAPISRKATREG